MITLPSIHILSEILRKCVLSKIIYKDLKKKPERRADDTCHMAARADKQNKIKTKITLKHNNFKKHRLPKSK